MTGILSKLTLKKDYFDIDGDTLEIQELSLKSRSQISDMHANGSAAMVPAAIVLAGSPSLSDYSVDDIAENMSPQIIYDLSNAIMALSGMTVDEEVEKKA